MYEIQSKSDFQTGVTLTLRIPDEDVDKKALYTIQNETPSFLIPFRHRAVDGQVEFIYQIGNRSKLAYLSGTRAPGEYIDLWVGLLQPLLDCSDWFMTPYSFMLNPEYLYCDKNGKSINYIYIPSLKPCSDYNSAKNMVIEVAKQNPVSDIGFENKVLRAMQEFDPSGFLEMVRLYNANSAQTKAAPIQHAQIPEPRERALPEQFIQRQSEQKPVVEKPAAENKIEMQKPQADIQKNSDGISINVPIDGKAPKKEKVKGGLFGSKKEKAEKAPRKQKEKSGGWGKKEVQQQEIMQGAAAMLKPEPAPEQPIIPIYASPLDFDDGVTQLDVCESDSPKLRYVGNGEHPRVIEVFIANEKMFTIGRFDASVGSKQSNFEFDKKTKAVSRRHAVIEQNADGYIIVDLNSAAGTFINGQKLSPNVPYKLEHGSRVSFGHSGADYIWEG